MAMGIYAIDAHCHRFYGTLFVFDVSQYFTGKFFSLEMLIAFGILAS